MAVIFLLLLLFLGGLGTVNHINFLLEAETITPWIVTTACGIIVCIVVFINRFREESKILPVLLVIGGVGIVQLIVYGNIDIPSYIKGDDGQSNLLFTAFSSQLLYLIIGYVFSGRLKKKADEKFNNEKARLRNILEDQTEVLDQIVQMLRLSNRSDGLTERIVNLFRLIDGDELREAFVAVQNVKDAEVLRKIREISPKAELTIQNGYTLGDVAKAAAEKRAEINNRMDELFALRNSRLNYKKIKNELEYRLKNIGEKR